jgi:hypothetical protein
MIKLTDPSVVDIYYHLLLGCSKKIMSVETRTHHDNEEQDNSSLSLLKHPKFLLTLYAAGIAGALIQILGTLINKPMTRITRILETVDSGNLRCQRRQR